jgi:hypothetical protein
MVANRFASAQASVKAQLQKWGVDPSTVHLGGETTSKLVRGDLSGLSAALGSLGSSGSAN